MSTLTAAQPGTALVRTTLPIMVSGTGIHLPETIITNADLAIPMHRAPITLDRLGNTGSAGVFTALHQAHAGHRITPGDTYLLSGIGAGFQGGTLCFRHA